jgi:hypothetical protein
MPFLGGVSAVGGDEVAVSVEGGFGGVVVGHETELAERVRRTALKYLDLWLLVSDFRLMVTSWPQVDSGSVMVPGSA